MGSSGGEPVFVSKIGKANRECERERKRNKRKKKKKKSPIESVCLSALLGVCVCLWCNAMKTRRVALVLCECVVLSAHFS